MKKLWKYRFYILVIIGQILMWCNITDTWHNNFKFVLLMIGMLISFIGVVLQIIIAPNYSKTNLKCPDCNANLNCQNGKITFKKHST